MHIDPSTLSADEALTILDELARTEPGTWAEQWYTRSEMSINQTRLWKREWQAWVLSHTENAYERART
jgi:starvation-inducible outer membrane lipoprotein